MSPYFLKINSHLNSNSSNIFDQANPNFCTLLCIQAVWYSVCLQESRAELAQQAASCTYSNVGGEEEEGVSMQFLSFPPTPQKPRTMQHYSGQP